MKNRNYLKEIINHWWVYLVLVSLILLTMMFPVVKFYKFSGKINVLKADIASNMSLLHVNYFNKCQNNLNKDMSVRSEFDNLLKNTNEEDYYDVWVDASKAKIKNNIYDLVEIEIKNQISFTNEMSAILIKDISTFVCFQRTVDINNKISKDLRTYNSYVAKIEKDNGSVYRYVYRLIDNNFSFKKFDKLYPIEILNENGEFKTIRVDK